MGEEQKEISDSLCGQLKEIVGDPKENRESQGLKKIDDLITEKNILELQKFDFRDEILEVVFYKGCVLLKKDDCNKDYINKKVKKKEVYKNYIAEYVSEKIGDKKCNVMKKTAFGKKWPTNEDKEKKLDYDYDSSSLSTYVFCKTIIPKHLTNPNTKCSVDKNYVIELQKSDEETNDSNKSYDFKLRGDTMNSWATTLKKFLGEYGKDYFEGDVPREGIALWEYLSNEENYKYGKLKKPLPLYITDFLDVVYTIGNFIPLPQNRSNLYCDYWDLFLAGVYNYFHSEKVINIEELSDIYINWLKNCYEEGENGWNEFVERNYMQPFVKDLGDKKYGEPWELWDGHFDGAANKKLHPKKEEQFKQFFVNARERILARGWLIAEALINNAKKDVPMKKETVKP